MGDTQVHGSIFLSHTGKDITGRTLTPLLYDKLKQLNPKRRVFFDEASISVGVTVTDVIKPAIQHCDVFVAIVTEQYLHSKWSLLELHWAREYGRPVFAALVEVSVDEVKRWVRSDQALEVWKHEKLIQEVEGDALQQTGHVLSAEALRADVLGLFDAQVLEVTLENTKFHWINAASLIARHLLDTYPDAGYPADRSVQPHPATTDLQEGLPFATYPPDANCSSRIAVAEARGMVEAWQHCTGPAVRSFVTLVQQVRDIMNTQCAALTECLTPLLMELARHIWCARFKCHKFTTISKHVEGSLFAWHVAATLMRISCEVQQLVLLLLAWRCSTETLSSACLDREVEVDDEAKAEDEAEDEEDARVPTHLGHLRVCLKLMEDESTSVADVDHALRRLQRSTIRLTEDDMATVQETYCRILEEQARVQVLAEAPVGKLLDAVSALSEHAASLRSQVAGVEATVGMDRADIMQVLGQMQNGTADELASKACKLQQSTDAADFRDFASVCKTAAEKGRVKFGFCFASNKPFARTGNRVPIKLPCECTVTRDEASSLQSASGGECSICREAIPSGAELVDVDTAVLRIVQLRTCERPPVLPRDCFKVVGQLGAGGQGKVLKAAYASQNGGEDMHVAVKEILLNPHLDSRKPAVQAALEQSITTTFMASESPHVCKMLGVSWESDDLWVIMELGDGCLRDFVDNVGIHTGERGLPAIDVLVLGWMLLDALGTVHGYAKSLHLDIKPDNVVLAQPREEQDSLSRRTIKLIDFGVGVALNTRASNAAQSSLVHGALGHTAGYAPPEQMKDRKARRASDIYAVGATMLFAATNENPYGNRVNDYQVMWNYMQGVQMPVSENIDEGLRDLILDMTRLDPTQRPSRLNAQHTIASLYLKLRDQGQTADYLWPYWGMPGKVPANGGDD